MGVGGSVEELTASSEVASTCLGKHRGERGRERDLRWPTRGTAAGAVLRRVRASWVVKEVGDVEAELAGTARGRGGGGGHGERRRWRWLRSGAENREGRGERCEKGKCRGSRGL